MRCSGLLVVLSLLPLGAPVAETSEDLKKTLVDPLVAGRVCICGKDNAPLLCAYDIKGELKFKVLFVSEFDARLLIDRVNPDEGSHLLLSPRAGCISVSVGSKPLSEFKGKKDAYISLADGRVFPDLSSCGRAVKEEPIFPACFGSTSK